MYIASVLTSFTLSDAFLMCLTIQKQVNKNKHGTLLQKLYISPRDLTWLDTYSCNTNYITAIISQHS